MNNEELNAVIIHYKHDLPRVFLKDDPELMEQIILHFDEIESVEYATFSRPSA
tara:strand:+ start:378 stop:536 length:159 start_codon:yes stop_codon:yes gene_type:complete